MKTVGDIASRVAGARVIGDRHAIITDIERDSRNVRFGTLFVCIPGAHVDGHDFIAQAAKSGATAILTTRDPEKGEVELPEGMAAIVVPDLHPALEAIVPFYYSYPARDMRIIGITGTNGKTTTSYLLRAILRSAGFRVGLIGTIQIMIEEEIFPVHNTTPDVADLQKILDLMREKNMDYVIMEVLELNSIQRFSRISRRIIWIITRQLRIIGSQNLNSLIWFLERESKSRKMLSLI